MVATVPPPRSRRWHLPLGGLKRLFRDCVSRRETLLAAHAACELHLSGHHSDIWQWLEVLACEQFGIAYPRLPETIRAARARAEVSGLLSEASRTGLVCIVVTMCTLQSTSRLVAQVAHVAQELRRTGSFSPIEQDYGQVPERVRVGLDALCPRGPFCQALRTFVRTLYLPFDPVRHDYETLAFHTENILVDTGKQQQQQLLWDALQLVCADSQVAHIRALQDIYNSARPACLRRPFLYHAILCVARDSEFYKIPCQSLDEAIPGCTIKTLELFSLEQSCPENFRPEFFDHTQDSPKGEYN